MTGEGPGARIDRPRPRELIHRIPVAHPRGRPDPVARPAIAIALPPEERGPVAAALAEADLEAVSITQPAELERLLASGADVAVAILDGENDFDCARARTAPARSRPRDPRADGALAARARAPLDRHPGRSATSTSPDPTRRSRCAGASRPC